MLVVLLDLAAAVHRQGAVDVIEDLRTAGPADRAQDLLPVRLIARIDRELTHPLALAPGPRHEINPLKRPAGLSNRRGELAKRLRPSIELDTDDDGELGGDRSHGRTILGGGTRPPGSTPAYRPRAHVLRVGFLAG